MYNYWIGKDTDYDSIWNDYDNGWQYEQKYRSMNVHLIRITLKEPAKNLPLFNFEAVFKTIKGYYHDLKVICLTENEYMSAGPLFVYAVNRGSGIWDFLGELRQLIMLGTTLVDQKTIGQKIDNMDKKIEFLQKHFGAAVSPEDFQKFMKTNSPRKLQKAADKLIEQGIKSVQISGKPFEGEIEKTEESLIDITELLDEADRESGDSD